MSRQTQSHSECHTLAVSSSGGGLSRQYRVQYRTAVEREWRIYGSFRTHEQAESAVNHLQRLGHQVRLIQYNIVPVAA